MRRALELAQHGRGSVSPNPMVGCVIVHDLGNVPTGRMLGEGWHRQYGGPHAEVNAIRAVSDADETLLPESTAYVTLEPCSHYGKTPPCADLLIAKKIGRVVCCNDDPNPLVSGQGFAKLRAAGIDVITGLLAEEGRRLNARFFTFFEQKRPHIILKWAETADGFIGGVGAKPVAISGPLASRLVHRWRSEEDAILVGTTTARNDNPRLNVRHWPGTSPMRIVLDRSLTLPKNLHLFDGSQPTRVYHKPAVASPGDGPNPNLIYVPADSLETLLTDLHRQRIQSVLVEGGAQTLTSFLEAGLWDEIRLFRSPNSLYDGVRAPQVRGKLADQQQVDEDLLLVYRQ
ncbi:bifunctional diaminohydroxyphosphoribosylaminopyrimidine deaminase/5-amino-6-(5-phosphoribosylamino)uracil reductase RibD [Fibrella forsythiae]|uniref:Riboflavin biosynthesis protein RibD n=1 Tax=Fibrella forsythiae TaxID=2817061 RepID=A0ABS3JFA2_9BACT|nr:bifunctional diaminohydroxyphosphoribosylaminopyrimidine deaminase/5-amino-6-(5-phosphoribosylamino)uracil reductase RibD [Fibrella forsythiae]MBO0948665.1 bifunctional diaminohydroxyphosphoribosylaminopyrimidine deaminase/5-amino-6-(5-phosphoribosylamino)uracil reductase RibD [Fibrella forsythiae]